MLRRLSSMLLVLACAFAPVAPALAAVLTQPDACCCEMKCPCAPMTECTAAPNAPLRTVPSVGAATEERATAAKPEAKVARLVFALAMLPEWSASSFSVSASRTDETASPAGVALFQAHCSLRI